MNIKTIACGLTHSGCVLSDGSVYQWGTCGDYAKLKEAKNGRELLSKAICQQPTKVSFRNHRELVQQSQPGGISQRKRSTQPDPTDGVGDIYASPLIKDLRMGEQFSIALSIKGYVYTWGMNEKGQLGLGNENPMYEPVQVPSVGPRQTVRPITKISCGLKHCLVLTSNDKLFAWGSNL